MTDSLTIFGVDYTGVTGIKATGTDNGTLAYIRPTGTKSITANGTGIDVAAYASVDVSVSGGASGVDIPIFTADENFNITCNKTYAECQALVSGGTLGALLRWTDGTSTYEDGLENVPTSSGVSYVMLADGVPNVQFNYASNGSITYGPPSSLTTLSATSNGTYTPSQGTVYNEVVVSVTAPSPSLQAKTNIDPTTSSQTITADNGYDGLSSVQINAMPSGTAGTPSATKGTVSNHAISVTPSVTNTTGYITGSTKTGTAVTVSASELVSGSETKTVNGTYDVTNLASLVVNVASPVKTATGTFTGNGTRTIDISSVTFEPDIVYFTSDPGTTSSSGTVAAIIVRGQMTATRYRNNSTTNNHYAIPAITGLNTGGSSYSWRATYDSTNSKLTLYCFSNNARALLTNGRTYTYTLTKYTT